MQVTKTKRVLVIEDEAFVGMMIEDFLGDFGYSVVGPIENLQAAILLAPGSEDTKFGVTMGPEVGHAEAEVYARVQA